MAGLLATLALAGSLVACGGTTSNGDPTAAPATETPLLIISLSPEATATEVGPQVGDVTWTANLQPGLVEPGDPVTSFPASTQTIYAVVPLRNIEIGSTLRADWFYNGEPLEGFASLLTFPENYGSGWVEFHLDRASIDAWPDGAYEIAISLNGTEVTRSTIEVVQD